MLEMVIEFAIFALGVRLYLRTTRAIDKTGKWAFRSLVILLAAIQLANASGSPPPNVTVLAWVGQAQWLLVAWGYWVDRHRA
jgi:hypothetical protein